MARRFVVAGSASQSINVFLQDRTSGDGVISMTTGKIAINYKIGTTGAITTIPTVAANTSDAFTASGTTHGWAELSSVKMPGVYRLDVPDASIASTPDVTYFIQCSTPGQNFIPVAVNLQVISSGGSDLPADVILYKGMAQTSVNIGTMLTSVNAKVTSVDSRLSSMDTMLSSVNAKVTSVDSRLSSMDTMLSSVNSKVTSIDVHVTSIDSRLTSMDTMLTSVNAHVTSVDSRLTSMDTMLTSVNAKVTSVDTKVSSMNTQVTSILANVTSIDTKVSAIQAQTTLFSFTSGDVNANIRQVGGSSTVPTNLKIVFDTGFDTAFDTSSSIWRVSGVALSTVDHEAIAAAVWDEATSSHATAGTFGKSVIDNLTKVTSIDSRLTSMDTMLTSVNSHVTSADTVSNSILTKVTSIDSRLTSMDTMLTSVNSHVTSVDSRLTSMDTMLSSVNAKVTSVDAKVSSIDTKVTAIQAQTTNLTFTVTGVVDANIQYVNDVAVQGTGTTTDTWRPV